MSKTNQPRSGLRTRSGEYPPEIRKETIQMFRTAQPEYKTKRQAAEHVAELMGIGCAETILSWEHQDAIDGGRRPGVTTTENEEIRRLRRENAELRRANGILKAASAFFAAELDRPRKE